MNTNELWQVVLGELELSLSKANFTTWFKQTFISQVDHTLIVIGVPNMFTKAWLEKKYSREIIKSLQEHTNGTIKQINYRVEIKPTNPLDVPLVRPTEHSEDEIGSRASSSASYQEPQEIRTGEFSLNGKYCFNTF